MKKIVVCIAAVLLVIVSVTPARGAEILEYLPADTAAFFMFNNFDQFLSKTGNLIHEVDENISADMFGVFVKQLLIKSNIISLNLEKEIAIVVLKDSETQTYDVVVGVSTADYNEFSKAFARDAKPVFRNTDAQIEILTRGSSEFYVLTTDDFVFIGKDLAPVNKIKEAVSAQGKTLAQVIPSGELKRLETSEVAYYLSIREVFGKAIERAAAKIDGEIKNDWTQALTTQLNDPVAQSNARVLVEALTDFMKSFFTDALFLSGSGVITDKGVAANCRITFDPEGSFASFIKKQNAGAFKLVKVFPRRSDYVIAFKYNPDFFAGLYDGWVEPILSRSENDASSASLRQGLMILQDFLTINAGEFDIAVKIPARPDEEFIIYGAMDIKNRTELEEFLNSILGTGHLEKFINTLFPSERNLTIHWAKDVDTHLNFSINEITFAVTKNGVTDSDITNVINPIIRYAISDALYFTVGGSMGDFKKYLDVVSGNVEGVLSGENSTIKTLFTGNTSVTILFSLSRLLHEAQSQIIGEQAEECFVQQRFLMDKIAEYNTAHPEKLTELNQLVTSDVVWLDKTYCPSGGGKYVYDASTTGLSCPTHGSARETEEYMPILLKAPEGVVFSAATLSMQSNYIDANFLLPSEELKFIKELFSEAQIVESILK